MRNERDGLHHRIEVKRRRKGIRFDAAFLRQFGIAFSLMNVYSLMFIRTIFDILDGKRSAKAALASMADDIEALQQSMRRIGATDGEN